MTYSCSCGAHYTEAVESLGHDYVGIMTRKATVSADGVMTFSCTRCGDSYTQTIKYVGAGTQGAERPGNDRKGEDTGEGEIDSSGSAQEEDVSENSEENRANSEENRTDSEETGEDEEGRSEESSAGDMPDSTTTDDILNSGVAQNVRSEWPWWIIAVGAVIIVMGTGIVFFVSKKKDDQEKESGTLS